MKDLKNRAIQIALIIALCMPLPLSATENYKFERMQPTLERPWYFIQPTGISMDPDGYLYILDSMNSRVLKFTEDGYLVTQWGKEGTSAGEFDSPQGVTVDDNGYVYVADTDSHRIQKFTGNGKFVLEWGGEGIATGKFKSPYDIAVDSTNHVYVADSGNNRIQKFSSNGDFLSTWDGSETAAGRLNSPYGISVDNTGHVFVADSNNNRIVKFNAEGAFIPFETNTTLDIGYPGKIDLDEEGFLYVTDTANYQVHRYSKTGAYITGWGGKGDGDDQFSNPWGISAHKNGYVYVVDRLNHRIQKFTRNGVFVSKWGGGSNPGEFNRPCGVAFDSKGYVYVADVYHHRIQKFGPDGSFQLEWGSQGYGEGLLDRPQYIAIDGNDDVYVSDTGNSRIVKFDKNGEQLLDWDVIGTSGWFGMPLGVAVDGTGFLFVADSGENCIYKYSPAGALQMAFGAEELRFPKDVAVDSSGFIYVTDSMHRVIKYNSNGELVLTWGQEGASAGEFDFPYGLAVDSNDDIYVADSQNHRIQKFNSDGTPVVQWGELGTNPGQMNSPLDVAVAQDGRVYVSDNYNHRIQVFKKIEQALNSKAIIVAGGGPYPGNNLWDATRMTANFAYRALTYVGLEKSAIRYLSADTQIDLDNNGQADDVYGPATAANLENAITEWAGDADHLLLYMVDHGGHGVFRLNEIETLAASDLNLWLNDFQPEGSNKLVTVIYDACKSGSFRTSLASDRRRIFIAGAGDNENAYFITQGAVSFSNFFWTNIFGGESIGDSFTGAVDGIGNITSAQTPVMAGCGVDPAVVYIGNDTASGGDGPLIEGLFPETTISGTNTGLLYASSVTDPDGVSRVWAVVMPPGYMRGDANDSVLDLPAVDLLPVDGDRYENVWHGFDVQGTYTIAVYARDRKGNTSPPQISRISVESPMHRRALIVVCGDPNAEKWDAYAYNATRAYNALTFQGYSDSKIAGDYDDVYILSAEAFVQSLDGTPSLSNINHAIKTWAGSNTRDLVVYMTGPGALTGLELGNGETLTPETLDEMLDNLQLTLPGPVTMIYDADYAGLFLLPPAPEGSQERILIAGASADRKALFESGGQISFSAYFWRHVMNGLDIRQSFTNARAAVDFFTGLSKPQLDDDGDGIGNELQDGLLAAQYTIGAGIQLAGNHPLIGEVCPDIELYGESSATIWADLVTAAADIDRVFAVVSQPFDPAKRSAPDLHEFELTSNNGRYEGVYEGFTDYGIYKIALYAQDADAKLSPAGEIWVFQFGGTPSYDIPDVLRDAVVIDVNSDQSVFDQFQTAGDRDCYQFYGLADTFYTIRATRTGPNCDVVFELYKPDGSVETYNGSSSPDVDEEWTWKCSSDGVYSILVRHADNTASGVGTQYVIEVITVEMAFVGYITGLVRDAATGAVIQLAVVQTSANGSALSRPSGAFRIVQEPGVFSISVQASGYQPVTLPGIAVSEGGTTALDIQLTPFMKDTDGDGVADEFDNCMVTANLNQSDMDGDGSGDVCDDCPQNNLKLTPGICGCTESDTDSDRNGIVDCLETTTNDTDGDGTPDSIDKCPDDPAKTDQGACGCGIEDADKNQNGIMDCRENLDSDGDGVPDISDGCPENTGKINPGKCGCDESDDDTDNDGTPDCKDECPDDPLKTKPGRCGCGVSEGDADGDGIPDCLDITVIQKPVLISPADGQTNVFTTATLVAGEFVSHSDASHSATHWQISRSPYFSTPVLSVLTSEYLTSLPLPRLLLKPEEDYYFRCRFYDDKGNISSWPDYFNLTTGLGDDLDKNGLPDNQEVETSIDLDQNGEPDKNQANIQCVKTESGDSILCLKSESPDVIVEAVAAVDRDTIPESGNKPENMPMGIVNSRLNVGNQGNSAIVTVYFTKSIPPDTYWYHYNFINGWDQYSIDVDWDENKTSVTFNITDGGIADIDGVKNGVVVFSAGPGTPSSTYLNFNFTSPDEDVDGIGCFLKTLSFWPVKAD